MGQAVRRALARHDGTGADVFSWLLAGSHTNLVIVLLTVVASMAWGCCFIAAMVHAMRRSQFFGSGS